MRAMVVDTEAAESSRLTSAAIEPPVIGPGELLVRATASGVNRADHLQRANRYRQPALARPGPWTIAGMEVAGTVAGVGEAVGGWSAGDHVMAVCGGSYAEFAAVDAALALPQPDGLTRQQAAALPVAMMTAYDAVALAGKLQPDQAVLVTAAASVVGQMACQVARVLGASVVIGHGRSERSRAAITSAGAHPLVAADLPQAGQLRELTGGRGPDLVIDHVGGDVAAWAIAALSPGGRLVSVGRLGQRTVNLDLNVLARERLSVVGTTFRTRPLDHYRAIAAGVRRSVLPAVARGQITPVLDRAFPLEGANDAIDHMLSPRAPGKVTLDIR
jgi:NADPH2:quinone reductase